MVEDWCHLKGDEPDCKGFKCTYWTQSTSFHSKLWADSKCRMGNDTVSSIYIFGGNSSGPYLLGLNNSVMNPFVDTKPRVAYAIELYAQRVGIPELIIYHTAQWDIQRLYELDGTRGRIDHGNYSIPHSQAWNTSLVEFETNLNHRLDEVIQTSRTICAQYNRSEETTAIGLRTAVWNVVGGPLLHAMNAIIRKTARQRGLTLYDLDSDVWGSVNWDYSLEKNTILRDWIHPVEFYTASAAEKLLGHRFTHNFEYRGSPESNYLFPIWLGAGTPPTSIMEVIVH